MGKEIKYIGFYDTLNNFSEHRNYTLSATDKMNYICNVLCENGCNVLIISPSRTMCKKFYSGKLIRIAHGISLKLFLTIPWGNKLQKAFSLFLGDIMLFCYLIINIKKNENIIVYHSLALRNVVLYAKKIKGFMVLLEVEELYHNVINCSNRIKKREIKVIENADKYIFSTELLNKKINSCNKQVAIVNGSYQIEEDRKATFGDNKIHLVYAGTFDPRKGATLAVATTEYLTEDYHVHIIGFGSKMDTKILQEKIKEISIKSDAIVTFDGLMEGEEYTKFIQKCDIGLSTQIIEASYNGTSFPSKILSYLRNGLRVLSVRINAIELSAIGSTIYYYEKQTPKVIAEAVLAIDLSEPYDSRELLKELDEKCKKSLKKMLEK